MVLYLILGQSSPVIKQFTTRLRRVQFHFVLPFLLPYVGCLPEFLLFEVLHYFMTFINSALYQSTLSFTVLHWWRGVQTPYVVVKFSLEHFVNHRHRHSTC